MTPWLEPTPVSVPDDVQAAVGGHPLVAERLYRRGIQTPDAAQRFLDPAAYTPAPPDDLPDMEPAVSRVRRAIQNRETILVWGDFDVDGQTATALLVSALRDLGAQVRYHIPNRFTEGHGVHLPTLKTLLTGGVDLLLTCDTGIAAHSAVDYANTQGVDVVITDHHTLPDTLPAARAVVNPMRLPAGHPLRELPGVGTAYQLARALYGAQPSDHLLDLVALGIVADVMVLVDDTRFWLQRGLDVLRQTARPGLRELLRRAEIDPAALTESDIGFALAPRLNALGRLADANPAVELLTTPDAAVIAERVNELEGLNQKRRYLTRQVYEAACQQIEADPALEKYAALVVAGEGWHTGVVGIVASRLVEEYRRPAIVLSLNDGSASGSARSVTGLNIVEAIRTQAHLLNTFGGHSMAAGLSLPADQVFAFRRGLSQIVREQLGQLADQPPLAIDAQLELSEISLELAEDIARLAPFGNGNPPLTLATRRVRITSRRTLDRRGDHLSVNIADASGHEQRVIWWFGDQDKLPPGWFDLAYTLRPNVFQGQREALVEWLEARPRDEPAAWLALPPAYTVAHDYRQQPPPPDLLDTVRRAAADVLVWREGLTTVDGVTRLHLRQAETLVVWTIPPHGAVWEAALKVIQPQRLILCAHRPPFDQPQALLQHLAGMLRYALKHKGGAVEISELAALTGQTEQMIRVSLKWLQTRLPLRLTALSEDRYALEATDQPPLAANPGIERLVQNNWEETRAYQRHWLKQTF